MNTLELHDLTYLSVVEYDGNIRAVVSATPRSVTLHSGNSATLAQLDQINPLPLTPDALLNLGFMQDHTSENHYTRAFEGSPDDPDSPAAIDVFLVEDSPAVVECHDADIAIDMAECESVHELQAFVWRNCGYWVLPAQFGHLAQSD